MKTIAIGDFAIHPIGAAIAFGVLASYYLARAVGERWELSRPLVSFIHLSALLGAVIGARMPAASEGRFFEPPGQWALSPSFGLLGAILLIEFARFRLQCAARRSDTYDLITLAAAPLFVFLSIACLVLGFYSELIVTLMPLLPLALRLSPRLTPKRGQLALLAFSLLALGAFLRLALPAESGHAVGLPEPALLGMVAVVVVVILARSMRRELRDAAPHAADQNLDESAP